MSIRDDTDKKVTKDVAEMSALVEFARDVLGILDGDRGWSPSTLDYIQDSAYDHGLGTTDNEGFFRRTDT